jgi:dTDP-4-amino-4,6-dideoxygalactose transaminase
MLRGIKKSMDSNIEFYEIDLKEEDWTLDQDSIDKDEITNCDLILSKHLFGVPFDQNKLFELGKKFNIPILEDCVQSGSMFGNLFCFR